MMKFYIQRVPQLLLVLIIMLAWACASLPANQGQTDGLTDERIVVQGLSAQQSVQAVRAMTDRLEVGNLRMRVELMRKFFKADFVEVKVYFRDDDGFAVEETNWQPVHLERDVPTLIEVVSLSSKASDYRMVVRPAQ